MRVVRIGWTWVCNPYYTISSELAGVYCVFTVSMYCVYFVFTIYSVVYYPMRVQLCAMSVERIVCYMEFVFRVWVTTRHFHTPNVISIHQCKHHSDSPEHTHTAQTHNQPHHTRSTHRICRVHTLPDNIIKDQVHNVLSNANTSHIARPWTVLCIFTQIVHIHTHVT